VDDVLVALEQQQAELVGLVGPLDDGGLNLPSRCEGWSIADVLLHLAQTNEMATASVQGRFDQELTQLADGIEGSGSVDDGAGALVAKQRGAAPSQVRERWRTSGSDLLAAFGACDPHQQVTWVAGQLAARTLMTTRLAETWIHTGDVAYGLGVDLPPTDRLWHITRLAWRTVPYAFAQAGKTPAGPVAFRLTAPDGSAWDFEPDNPALTVVTGDAADVCALAGQRADAGDTSLRADGPDAADVLALMRTFA
jgi:uncharacterized protein (TIGR03084 family)